MTHPPEYVQLPNDCSLHPGTDLLFRKYLNEKNPTETKPIEHYNGFLKKYAQPAEFIDWRNGCYLSLAGYDKTAHIEWKFVWSEDGKYGKIASPRIRFADGSSKLKPSELGWTCEYHSTVDIDYFLDTNIRSDWQLMLDLLAADPKVVRSRSYFRAINNHHPGRSLNWLSRKQKALTADVGLYSGEYKRHLPPLLHRSASGYVLTEAGNSAVAKIKGELAEFGLLEHVEGFLQERHEKISRCLNTRQPVIAGRKVVAESILRNRTDGIEHSDYQSFWGYPWPYGHRG